MVYRHGASKPFYVAVQLPEYDLQQALWKDKPETMIKKVAEAQCLRMAFQELFGGTYCESEMYMTDSGEPIPIKSERLQQVNEHFGLLDDIADEFPPLENNQINAGQRPTAQPAFSVPDAIPEPSQGNGQETGKHELIKKCLNYLIGTTNYAA
jgi:hypothetical protein